MLKEMERETGFEPARFSLGSSTQWILSGDLSTYLQKPDDTACTPAALNCDAEGGDRNVAACILAVLQLPLPDAVKAAILSSLLECMTVGVTD